MNELMVFEGNSVEAFEFNGEVLFNAYHIGMCLGMGDRVIREHMSEMDEDEVLKLTNKDLDGTSTAIRKLNNAGERFLTESGVYTLIMKSRKPEAVKFQKWITKVVLPSIRKNGGYIQNQEVLTPEQILANAMVVAQKVIAEKELLLQQKESIIQEQLPKVEFYDDVTGSSDTIDMGEVAKILNIKGVGRNKLFDILRKKKVLMGNNIPYQSYVDKGWFRLVESKYSKPNGDTCINIKTVVFQTGVDGIRKILQNLE